MFRSFLLFALILIIPAKYTTAQYDAPLYASYTTIAERNKLYERLTNYSIIKNFSLPLSDSTEENWESAFNAMELLNFKSAFSWRGIHSAFDSILERSTQFQRALLEVAYANYPGEFISQTKLLLNQTTDPKIFAICAEYLIQPKKDEILRNNLYELMVRKFGDSSAINPILFILGNRLKNPYSNFGHSVKEVLHAILDKNFLPNQIVMYSFQRKDRDFPGMVLVRNAIGEFMTDSSGNIFNIPQLARSISNLPGYLTYGNTPQGIYKMYGFQVSTSSFIGPTANVQLGMPVELSLQKFFDDSTISDSIWTIDYYQKLLPGKLKDYLPLCHSFYAGLAGRTEIIAHGTTIDPKYYYGKPYYPLTPSEGCLCTKEIWDGNRILSDQQKLVNALLNAGGADGYCVVIELDDQLAPVNIADIMPYLKK